MFFNESGTTADGTAVSGKIEIPEVAHDTDTDDYVVSLASYFTKWNPICIPKDPTNFSSFIRMTS